MNVRHPLAAILVVAGLLTLTACGSTQAGTALPGSPGATISSTSAVSSPTPTTPTTAATTPTTAATTRTTATATPNSTAPSGPVIDAVTRRWVTGMCTDMGTLFAALMDIPDVDEASSVAVYRQAFVRYYTHVADAAQNALAGAEGATPPKVKGGAKIHEAFVRYLTGLADIATNGAALVNNETTVADISADLQQISNEIEDLGNGEYGLGTISSPELESAVDQVPACKNVFGRS